jgi:hypothetical protein
VGGRRSHSSPTAAVETGITVCFLALAAWFLFGPSTTPVPHARSAPIVPAEISTAPARVALGDEPVTVIAGFEMRCMECHALFRSRPETARRLTQHQQIVLDHGLTDRCFNCHDDEQRDRLSLRGDKTVPFSQVARLCAKCHGPTYRDWQKGMHGRTMGAWDPHSDRQRRLICSECHDPHAPAFDPVRPLPGPNTLRMGPPGPPREQEPTDLADPLRRWQHEADRPHPPVPPGKLDPPHTRDDSITDAEEAR